MKIFTLLLFCFFSLLSAALSAKPICTTFSVPEDTLFLGAHSKADCDNSPALIPDAATKSESLLPTLVAVGDFCGQGSGFIDATPDPNTPGPWVYHWSTGATTEDLLGLTAGTYTVTIFDANGNEQVAQADVVDLPSVAPLDIHVNSISNTNCNGPFTGALDLTVLPLTAPWTYEWSNGATTQDVTDLASGNHFVTITMGVTCSTVYQFTVPDNSGIPFATIPGHQTATCGRSDGATGVLVNGGVMPYSYIWSNGVTTSGNQNIPPGDYSVTVSSPNGCTSSASVTVGNQIYNMLIDTSEVILTPNTTCIGNNGSIDILVVHSIIQGPFTYLWSNGATTQDLSNLPSGTYFVTATIHGDCYITEGYYIEDDPQVPDLTFSNTNTTCGFSNGYVNLTTLAGGTPPYTYLWSNGATTQDLANVPADTYIVTVTGINGCTTTGSATLDDTPIPFSYSALVTDHNACDTSNGQINLFLYPGTLTYQWSNGATTKINKNLEPGNYTVTISAGGNCTAVETFNVGDVTEYPSIPAAPTASTCGLPNGSINLTVAGYAEPPFTYQWSNGATTEDLSGILADTFYVTVTSALGCSQENIVIVPNVNDTLKILANVADNLSCALPTGNISLNITPLDTSYTFLWSSGQTVDSLSNLAAGTYLVTVTLGVSCIALDTFEVLNNALPPNLATAGAPANCGLDIGSVDLSVSGGTGPFVYLWSNAATTEDLTNLTPGTYAVTVSGANNCTAVSSATVLNTNVPLNVNGLPTGNTSCLTGNGSLDIGVTPAGTYNYQWSNMATTEDLANLAAGTYTVTVSLGTCVSSGIFSVADNALSPNLSASGLAANCGLSNGAADLNLSGGTGPFSFIWSNAATTEDLANLLPGSYTVTVTGANACTAVSTANVLNNNITLNLSAAPTGNSSCTAANGAVDISVIPAGTYTYLWSNAASTEDISNLNSGTFTVTVTLGTCQSSSTFSVADNTATPIIAANITAAICSLNNGEIDLNVSGTAGPFSYLWSNMATTEDLSAVLPGNYSVTVTAPNGCTEIANLNVANNASTFSLAATPAPLTNCATDNGAIDLNVTPLGAFTYLWSNGAVTEDLNGLAPGTYTVSVTQSGSCTATASYFVLDQRSSPISAQTIVPELCGLSDGSIDLVVSGGTLPYSYLWNAGQVSQDLGNLSAGTYTVSITDANDCTVTSVAVVPGNSIAFFLAGTPSDNSSCLQNNGAVDLSVNPPPTGGFTYLWSNMATTEDLNSLNAGTYTVTVSAGGNCTNTAVFTLVNDVPSPLVAQNVSPAFCGQASGGIDLSVSGSPAPYDYLWSNAATTEDLSGIVSNTYSVTVTAANGCTTTENFTVPENVFTPAIDSQLSPSTSCVTSNGAIDLTILPAQAYTFLWSNMATTEDLVNLPAGNYTVTVSGGGTCTNTAVLTVGSTVPLPVLSDNIAAATCGQASGSIDMSVTGSSAPYGYLWSNAATTEDLANILSGSFTVTVTAANGCTSTGSYTVPENTIAPVISGTPSPASSCVAVIGAIDLTVGPANGYAFIWSNAATTEDLSGIAAGSYTVTVNGGGACVGTASFTVADQTTQPLATIHAATTALNCSTTSTILNGSVTGTPNPSSFQWSANGTPLGTGSTLPVNTPGQYDLVVQDNLTFCTASASITVTQNLDPPNLVIASPALLTCASPVQTLAGSSLLTGVQFSWATIIGTDTTIVGSGPGLQVSAGGTYFLLGINPANNCANAVSVSVLVDQNPPTANAGTPFTLDCAGETAPLNGSGSGANSLTYQWTSQDGHFVSGAGTASPLIDKAGTYQLLVTNTANGCTDMDLVTIEPEVPMAFASVIQPTCLDQQGKFQIDSVTGLSQPILYSLNSGAPAAQNQFTNLEPGTYTLEALGGNGCSALVEAVINPPALLEITLAPEATILLGYTYQIDAQVNIPDSDIASVSWTPGTGLVCDTCLSTEAAPYSTTDYQLLVVSDQGCEARGTLHLIVDRTRHIYAPNIFSPDDDGRNDLFSIYGDPVSVVKIKSLQVFSRWGEQVFELQDFGPNDTQTGWDGTHGGQRMNPAVFVWQAVVLFIDGKEEYLKGDVTLQR